MSSFFTQSGTTSTAENSIQDSVNQAAASATQAANAATTALVSKLAAITTTTTTAGVGEDAASSYNSSDNQFSFTIPRGITGDAATLAVGNVTTGVAGSSVTVVNSGTTNAAILDFTIPKGDTGIQGVQGDTGSTGSAATIAVGTVTTGAAGSSATVANTGTAGAATFDFTIPRGDTGAVGATGTAATIAVGTVTTGATGSSATVTNSGTSSAAVLDFTIPTGAQGASGSNIKEMLLLRADGNSVTVDSGTYSLTNITSPAYTDYINFTELGGSRIVYTPPSGTNIVYYEYTFLTAYYSSGEMLHLYLDIDGTEVTASRITVGESSTRYGREHTFVFPIVCNASTQSAVNGNFTSWTSSKTLKVMCRAYNSGLRSKLHETYYWAGLGGSSGSFLHKPHLKITSLS